MTQLIKGKAAAKDPEASAESGIQSSLVLRVLTPHGTAAIAAIELSGRGAGRVVEALVGLIPQAVTLRPIKADGNDIDDVLIVPRGAEHFELHCHGGLMVVEKLVRHLAHLVGGGVNADQVLEAWRHPPRCLPEVETIWALRMLAQAHHHGASAWARVQKTRLSDEGGLAAVKRQAQWMLSASADLHRLMDGQVRIALIGPPNAGKSSLANFWLGQPMSVTSDIPGTTRDWVEQTVRVSAGEVELTARLTDTAGMRYTTDQLERLAIDGGISTLAHMHVIVVLMDITEISTPQQLRSTAWRWALEHRLGDKLTLVPWIAVGSKCDLLPPSAVPAQDPVQPVVWLSARTGMGMAALQTKIMQVLAVPEMLRHPVIDPAQRARLESLILSHDDAVVRALLDEIASADDGMF